MTVDVLGRVIDGIDVLEADAVVHRTYPLRARPLRATGGGDTDFGPALAEVGRRRDIDGVLYFTDGRGLMPTAAPRVPLLWVITHDEPFEPPLGTVVRLPVGGLKKISARAATRRTSEGLREQRFE